MKRHKDPRLSKKYEQDALNLNNLFFLAVRLNVPLPKRGNDEAQRSRGGCL